MADIYQQSTSGESTDRDVMAEEKPYDVQYFTIQL